MKRNKAFLWMQAALCAAVCVLLAAGAVSICAEGLRLRAAGNAAAPIFTPEKAEEALKRLLPLILAAAAFTAAGLALGIRDEGQDRPAESIRNGMTEGDAAGGHGRTVRIVRIVLAVLAAGLIVHGVFNGSMRDVFVKAIRICSECIGLG